MAINFGGKNKLVRAAQKYKRGLEFLTSEYGLNDAELSAFKDLKVQLHNNYALVCEKQYLWKEVVEHCTGSLQQCNDAQINTKAYLRRGVANRHLGIFLRCTSRS